MYKVIFSSATPLPAQRAEISGNTPALEQAECSPLRHGLSRRVALGRGQMSRGVREAAGERPQPCLQEMGPAWNMTNGEEKGAHLELPSPEAPGRAGRSPSCTDRMCQLLPTLLLPGTSPPFCQITTSELFEARK